MVVLEGLGGHFARFKEAPLCLLEEPFNQTLMALFRAEAQAERSVEEERRVEERRGGVGGGRGGG